MENHYYNDAFDLKPPNGTFNKGSVGISQVATCIDVSASTVIEAFYWGEVENELRSINMDYFFRKDSDRE